MAGIRGDFNVVGEVSWRWCKDCWERTEQVWDGEKWVCTACDPKGGGILEPQSHGDTE